MTSSSRSDSPDRPARPGRIVIVGPCASGKTTLARGLAELGYEAFSVAQEHSSIRRMYARRNPEHLVYLDVSYGEIRRRRPISWGPARLEAIRARLAPAREDADLVVQTDGKTPAEVLREVLHFIDGGENRA